MLNVFSIVFSTAKLQHLLEMAILPKSINTDSSKHFTVARVAEKHRRLRKKWYCYLFRHSLGEENPVLSCTYWK